MWFYFLIIIASDKVINFKTTFFSWSKWLYTEISRECREGLGPGTQAIASALTASVSPALRTALVINEHRPLHQEEPGMEMG